MMISGEIFKIFDMTDEQQKRGGRIHHGSLLPGYKHQLMFLSFDSCGIALWSSAT